MSSDLNIFKGLEELMRHDYLSEIRKLDAIKNASELGPSQSNEENDFDDLDCYLNNNVNAKKSVKRASNLPASDSTRAKPKKNDAKGGKAATSKEISAAPSESVTLEEGPNVSAVSPAKRQTRRSVGRTRKETNATQNSNRTKKNAPARGRKSTRQRRDSFISQSSSVESDTSFTPEVGEVVEADTTPQPLAEGGRVSTRRATRRNYRNAMLQMTAALPIVNTIDLVSSPVAPRIEATITLDSDDEPELPRTRSRGKKQKSPRTTKSPTTTKTDKSLDISFDEDNPEISVKINWKGKPEAFKLRKYQKFRSIFEELAQREGTEMKCVVLNLRDHILSPDDTPDSIGYKIIDFISGRVVELKMDSPLPLQAQAKKRDPNLITLKVQSDLWKRPLQIDLRKTEAFRILYIKCAMELKVDLDRLKLSFDGEQLELNGTPVDLDLEGGEAIDLRLKN